MRNRCPVRANDAADDAGGIGDPVRAVAPGCTEHLATLFGDPRDPQVSLLPPRHGWVNPDRSRNRFVSTRTVIFTNRRIDGARKHGHDASRVEFGYTDHPPLDEGPAIRQSSERHGSAGPSIHRGRLQRHVAEIDASQHARCPIQPDDARRCTLVGRELVAMPPWKMVARCWRG